MIPLLIVTGPTAAGKTALGVELARRLDGEIVSADSVAVYRGLDIGSDKPGPAEQRGVPHHLLDVCDPDIRFSAGDFVDLAAGAIRSIHRSGRTPIVVGGSLFYLRALLHGLFPAPPRDPAITERLNREWERNPDAVRNRLESADPATLARAGANDRQRILRALDFFEQTGVAISVARNDSGTPSDYRPFTVVPVHSHDTLCARIDERVDMMYSGGLLAEISGLLASGIPHDAHAFKAIGYRQGVACVRGRTTLEEAIDRTKRATRTFAGRQSASIARDFGNAALHVASLGTSGVDDIAERFGVFVTESG